MTTNCEPTDGRKPFNNTALTAPPSGTVPAALIWPKLVAPPIPNVNLPLANEGVLPNCRTPVKAATVPVFTKPTPEPITVEFVPCDFRSVPKLLKVALLQPKVSGNCKSPCESHNP